MKEGLCLLLIAGSELYGNPPVSRTVEFAKEDGLPRPQHKLAVLNKDMRRHPDDRRLDMSRGVPLAMMIIPFKGDQLVQICLDITLYGRICAFIDRYAGSRMGNEQITDAVGYACFLDRLLDLFRDVDEFRPCLALYIYVSYHLIPLR